MSIALVLGTVWLLIGGIAVGFPQAVTGLRITPTAAWSLVTAGALALGVAWPLARVAGRKEAQASGPPTGASKMRIFPGVAMRTSGVPRTATVAIDGASIAVRALELRPWRLALVVIGVVAYGVLISVFGTGGRGPGGIPWHLFLFIGIPQVMSSVRRPIPVSKIVAIRASDRIITIYRSDEEPTELATKSWQFARMEEALRNVVPAAFDAEVPASATAEQSDVEQAVGALSEFVPEGRDMRATFAGGALIAISLALGAVNRLGVTSGFPIEAVIATAIAVAIWMADFMRTASATEAARHFDAKAKPVIVAIERNRGDFFALLSPWRQWIVTQERDRIVLTHESRDDFDALVLIGLACLGGYLVLDAVSPLRAGVYWLLLRASGYPRPRGLREEILVDHVRELHDRGSRATLLLDDEDGPREISLRFGSGNGPRFAALVHEACPDARMREPLWRAKKS